jgi:hypothetical protein
VCFRSASLCYILDDMNGFGVDLFCDLDATELCVY